MRFVKETVGIVLIIVFIITIEFITTKVTNNSLSLINSEIETIENTEDNLKEDVYKLSNDWEKERKELSCYIEHSELDKISESINLLVYYSQSNDQKAIEKNLTQIKFKMEEIKHKQKLNIENIF